MHCVFHNKHTRFNHVYVFLQPINPQTGQIETSYFYLTINNKLLFLAGGLASPWIFPRSTCFEWSCAAFFLHTSHKHALRAPCTWMNAHSYAYINVNKTCKWKLSYLCAKGRLSDMHWHKNWQHSALFLTFVINYVRHSEMNALPDMKNKPLNMLISQILIYISLII